MEINDLIIFKTVVNEGSISRAAKELGYVQPNVTERIKKLEQELETPLLHRYHRGISVLPSGEILLGYTDKILTLLEEAKRELKTGSESYRIGTTQSILSTYLSARIKHHFKEYQIYMENSHYLKELLNKQRVDLVMTYTDYSDAAFQKVFTSTISMGLLKAKGKSAVDYSNELFFVSHDSQCPFRNRTIEFLKEHSISPKQLHHVDSYTLVKEFVEQEKGVAFLPVTIDSLEIINDIQLKKIPIYFFTNRSSTKTIPKELIS